MAIQKSVNLENGVALTDAYLKAKSIAGTKTGLVIELTINVSSDLSDQNKPVAIINYYFTPDLLSEDNFFKQAYTYLKTLPEYTDALDV